MADRAETILEVRNLHTHFHTESGVVRALEGVDFTLNRGQEIGRAHV